MSAITILSALANPGTAAAAHTVLEIATASLRLMDDLDKPDMSPDDKRRAWDEIKNMIEAGDAILDQAITSHPAWIDGPQSPPPGS